MKKNHFATTKSQPITGGKAMSSNINRTHAAVGAAKKRLKERTGRDCRKK